MQYINALIFHQACFVEPASNCKTARASSRDSACRDFDMTLRANVPKVSAAGTSPKSALPSVVSARRGFVEFGDDLFEP